MSWTNTAAEYQNDVIASLRSLAGELYNEETGGNPLLANAYLAAIDELELWINTDRTQDPFTLWLETHKEDLQKHLGRAVAIHLDKGVVASAEVEAFWDGSLRSEVSSLFPNDPKVYITVVPLKEEEMVQATEQQ